MISFGTVITKLKVESKLCSLLKKILPIKNVSHRLISMSNCCQSQKQEIKTIPKLSTLSMSNPNFSHFVNDLVINQTLSWRLHNMLTSKLNDYDLISVDIFELSQALESEEGEEFRSLVKADIIKSEDARAAIESDLVEILTTALGEDGDDGSLDRSDVTMEFEAGPGGIEATIFNHQVFLMYQNFCRYQGWNFIVESIKREGTDYAYTSLHEAVVRVIGQDAYDILKFEAGVHRVQRVPVTGTKIETSTCAVTVTPTVVDSAIELKSSDLKFDFFRSQGAGGQSVNVTNSAVRVTHLPTGLVQECQDERNQMANKDKAVDLLCQKVYLMERDKILEANQRQRKIQIGTKDRSLKIRTYNFPQCRVTDHRIGLSLGSPESLLEGGPILAGLIDKLREARKQEALQEKLEDFKQKLKTQKK